MNCGVFSASVRIKIVTSTVPLKILFGCKIPLDGSSSFPLIVTGSVCSGLTRLAAGRTLNRQTFIFIPHRGHSDVPPTFGGSRLFQNFSRYLAISFTKFHSILVQHHYLRSNRIFLIHHYTNVADFFTCYVFLLRARCRRPFSKKILHAFNYTPLRPQLALVCKQFYNYIFFAASFTAQRRTCISPELRFHLLTQTAKYIFAVSQKTGLL